MNAKQIAIMLLLICPILLFGQKLFVVNSQSRTLSRIDLDEDSVDNNFAQLGNIPNKVLVTQDYLWVVNSGDNSLQKISTTGGNTLGNFFVEPSSNPWDAIMDNNDIYITVLSPPPWFTKWILRPGLSRTTSWWEQLLEE
jgi:hypothetical protein